QTSTAGCTPHKRHGDQTIDRSIFQKVNAIGKKRDRTNKQGCGELHGEVCQVQGSNNEYDSAHRHCFRCQCRLTVIVAAILIFSPALLQRWLSVIPRQSHEESRISSDGGKRLTFP